MPARYLTADVAPLGGRIKERPEDFLVEEQPLYQPAGEGEHIYLMVEKRGMSTLEMVGVVARHFGVRPFAVGYAGMKDKHAITRQVVSVHVPGRKIEDFPMLEHDRIGVLWADSHQNKLRTGHLAGNRFSIRIRGVSATAALPAKRVLDRLERLGVPNRFGEQRFGHAQNNHVIGRELILGNAKGALDAMLGPTPSPHDKHGEARALYAQGKYQDASEVFPRSLKAERDMCALLTRVSPEQAIGRLNPTVRRFMVSAFQSAVFNAVLDARMGDGSYSTLLLGDIAHIHASRGEFLVSEATMGEPDLADRVARLELSPTGPMWGVRMKRAGGAIDALEASTLATHGVGLADLEGFAARWRDDIEGSRRPLRVPITDTQVEGGVDEHGSYVRVAFDLPRGAFATVVLREIMKPAAGEGIETEA